MVWRAQCEAAALAAAPGREQEVGVVWCVRGREGFGEDGPLARVVVAHRHRQRVRPEQLLPRPRVRHVHELALTLHHFFKYFYLLIYLFPILE